MLVISRNISAGSVIKPIISRIILPAIAGSCIESLMFWAERKFPRDEDAIILSDVRSASAMIVTIGLAPNAVGQAPASPTHTPFTS